MSRTAITLGFPHGGGAPVIIHGTKVPIHEQRAALKKRRNVGVDSKFERVELWFSNSAVRAIFEKDRKAKSGPALGTMPPGKEGKPTDAPVKAPESTPPPEDGAPPAQ